MTEAYQGSHLLADMHGCIGLSDKALVEEALRAAARAANATLLGVHVHGFGPGEGVTGVALLAESHISIHTWPERGYAALDFFLCGGRHDVRAALAAISERLAPAGVTEHLIARGYGAGRLARP